MKDDLQRQCPGEAYTLSEVVCKERQRRGWGKCRVCAYATLEGVVSIKPARQVEEPAEVRRRRYYLVKKSS